MTLFMLFYEIMISIDLYMVKALLGSDFLTGIYNGALTVGRIPYYLFYALTIVLLPTISKTTSSNNEEETRKVVSQSLRLLFIFLFPGIILMYIFAPQILNIFYGGDFIQGASAMSILVIGVGFLTIFYVMSFALNGAGKVKLPMRIAFFGAILNSGLNWIFIPLFSIQGAAVATSISSAFAMVIMLYFIQKHFRVPIITRSLLKIVLSSMILYFASIFLPQPENWTFLLWATVLFLIYIISLFALKEISHEDKDIFRKLITRK